MKTYINQQYEKAKNASWQYKLSAVCIFVCGFIAFSALTGGFGPICVGVVHAISAGIVWTGQAAVVSAGVIGTAAANGVDVTPVLEGVGSLIPDKVPDFSLPDVSLPALPDVSLPALPNVSLPALPNVSLPSFQDVYNSMNNSMNNILRSYMSQETQIVNTISKIFETEDFQPIMIKPTESVNLRNRYAINSQNNVQYILGMLIRQDISNTNTKYIFTNGIIPGKWISYVYVIPEERVYGAGHKSRTSTKMPTSQKVIINGRKRVVYEGPRGGKYYKSKGKFIRM